MCGKDWITVAVFCQTGNYNLNVEICTFELHWFWNAWRRRRLFPAFVALGTYRAFEPEAPGAEQGDSFSVSSKSWQSWPVTVWFYMISHNFNCRLDAKIYKDGLNDYITFDHTELICQDGNAARRAANVLSAALSCCCKRDVEGMDEIDVNLKCIYIYIDTHTYYM